MDLVDEIKLRPADGARRLVAEYRERLYQVAYRLCLNDADAEDLTFRTLARAVERIDSFDGKSSFFTWLCAIMMNFRRMDMRRKGANALDLVDELPDIEESRPDPGEALSKTEEADAIREAVESLPDVLREPTVLYYFDGFNVPDIADMMALPEGTVYYRLHLARSMLREKLAPRFREEGASNETEREMP